MLYSVDASHFRPCTVVTLRGGVHLLGSFGFFALALCPCQLASRGESRLAPTAQGVTHARNNRRGGERAVRAAIEL